MISEKRKKYMRDYRRKNKDRIRRQDIAYKLANVDAYIANRRRYLMCHRKLSEYATQELYDELNRRINAELDRRNKLVDRRK